MPIEQSDPIAHDLWTHSTHSKQTNQNQNIITDVLTIIDNIFSQCNFQLACFNTSHKFRCKNNSKNLSFNINNPNAFDTQTD